jgi:hypothetical protein
MSITCRSPSERWGRPGRLLREGKVLRDVFQNHSLIADARLHRASRGIQRQVSARREGEGSEAVSSRPQDG